MSLWPIGNRQSRKVALKLGLPLCDPDTLGSVTLCALWKSLEKFSEKMEHFFMRGFEGLSPVLESSPDYSLSFIFRTISDQVGHDMEILNRALGQRMIYHKPESATVLKTLKIADWIAYDIGLKPAIDAGFLPLTTAITYFEKSLNSRVVPYAPVALIGFPFRTIAVIDEIVTASMTQNQASAGNQPPVFGDLLAIPHEVGHYVYWHSPGHGNQLTNAVYRYVFGRQPQWVLNWLEEFYADIYGYVIAGPVAALQLMNLLQTGSRKSLLFDDGEHPVPVLRIYAAVDALDALQLTQSARSLENAWSDWVKTQITEEEFHPADNPEETIPLVEARRIVKEVVQAIIALDFIELHTTQREAAPQNWSELNRDQQAVLDEYSRKFDEIIKMLIEQDAVDLTIPALIENGDTIQIDHPEPLATQSSRPLGKTNTWLDDFLEMEQSAASPTPRIQTRVWMAILIAGGWVTGPGGGNPHPPN